MSRIARSLALALAALVCAGFGPAPRVDYVLEPVFANNLLSAIQVDLTFRAPHRSETPLQLPSQWGGQQQLWTGIQNLEVVSGATMRDGADAWHRALHHLPDAQIHVRYRVIQDWQGDPSAAQGNPYRPVLRPTYFHLIGNAFLIEPGLDETTPVHVSVHNLPRGWSFASDLEHPGLTLGRMTQSVAVGGDYRVVRGADPRIRVAIRGQWTFTDADFTQRVNTIVSGERAFWRDRTSPYLVTVTQISALDPGWLSIGGTGLDDAFAFFATPNGDERQITRTLAHEGLHTWIPAQVGGMPEENEAADYWFSEGFTDFYTGRVLVREGVWTPADFATDFNDMLRAYATSPFRTEPNSRVVADFWHNEQIQHLPYQRGRMLATLWDARLRALHPGRSLDDVMFAMRDRASHGALLKSAQLLPAAMQSMGVDISTDIAAYADRGEAIALPENSFAPCGRITTRQAPNFSRGFDIATTQANHNIIAGVDATLPAYAAGLRNGMVLIRRDHGTIGDSEHELAYIVRDGDAERTIAFMPQDHTSYTLQTFVLDDHLDGGRLAQCHAVLAGG